MTVRKLWLIVLISVSVLSIGINAVVLSSLTDRYFKGFLAENYDAHMQQVMGYVKAALLDENVSYRQMTIELETHLGDPITKIKLYGADGELLVSVVDESRMTGGMMNGDRMAAMRGEGLEEVEQYKIEAKGQILGIINVTRQGSTENSLVAWLFKMALLRNSIFSVVIAVFVSLVIGWFVSRKMSRALKETAEFAGDIQTGKARMPEKTSIVEVNSIRESLENLNTRLKLKQKSRKALTDQLLHQTRTPLTVLKSHLEAMEDGVIEMNAQEISICQNQLENLEAIITNVSGLIDASREIEDTAVEVFEFGQMMGQICEGMKAQFGKKKIYFELATHDKVMLETDQYKLSQAIYNVLTNAYKYTEEGGRVIVRYLLRDGVLRLEIEDTGIGIREEELKHIFNAYYRGEDAIHTDGEGIGLFIAKENLARIGGGISVKSRLGSGSLFILEVPEKI